MITQGCLLNWKTSLRRFNTAKVHTSPSAYLRLHSLPSRRQPQLSRVRAPFQALIEASSRLWTSCERQNVHLLGLWARISSLCVYAAGSRPLISRVQALHNFLCRTTKRPLWEFLSLNIFHRKFMPQCPVLLWARTMLLSIKKKGATALEMNDAATTAFLNKKAALETATLLSGCLIFTLVRQLGLKQILRI